MTKDKLSATQRIRLESIAQAVNVTASIALRDTPKTAAEATSRVIEIASAIETFIVDSVESPGIDTYLATH